MTLHAVERTIERTALIEKRAAQMRKGAAVLKWIAIIQPPVGLAILALYLPRYPVVAGVIGGALLADAATMFAVRMMLLGQIEEFDRAKVDAAAFARVWDRIAAKERRR